MSGRHTDMVAMTGHTDCLQQVLQIRDMDNTGTAEEVFRNFIFSEVAFTHIAFDFTVLREHIAETYWHGGNASGIPRPLPPGFELQTSSIPAAPP